MTTANEVREYALVTFIKPARRRGANTVAFTSTDIHKGMGLEGRFPLVCSAIDAEKFQDYASVILSQRDGPKQSSTVRWVFDLNEALKNIRRNKYSMAIPLIDSCIQINGGNAELYNLRGCALIYQSSIR